MGLEFLKKIFGTGEPQKDNPEMRKQLRDLSDDDLQTMSEGYPSNAWVKSEQVRRKNAGKRNSVLGK